MSEGEDIPAGTPNKNADVSARGSTSTDRATHTELLIAAGFGLGAIIAVFFTISPIGSSGFIEENSPRALAGLLIGGLLTFIFGIAALVAGFKALSLTANDQPLGLPAGSIQAFIALFLILLFFIMSVFLYSTLVGKSDFINRFGLTESEIDEIPPELIVDRFAYDVDVEADDPDTPDIETVTQRRFDVVVRQDIDANTGQVAEDIARQLVTTIGTLIVAIASFYFGAKGAQDSMSNRDPGIRS